MRGWVEDVKRAATLPSNLPVCVCVMHLYLPSFPESPERLHAIKEQLILEGLQGRCISFQVNPPAYRWWEGNWQDRGIDCSSSLFLMSPQARFAEKEELMLVHR